MNAQARFSAAAKALRRDDLMLAALYFAQALPMGLAWLGLPPWLRAHGIGLEAIGATGLSFLPWALKFLWAAPVEGLCIRHGVRPVIAATQATAALVFGLLAFVHIVAALPLGLALLTLLNALCATQDIATDRYAILRRGAAGAARVNTARFVGFTLGMLTGGSGLLLAGEQWGWPVFMGACGIWMLVMACAMYGLREPAPTVVSPPARVRLRGFFAKPHAWRLLGIALLFKTAGTSSDGMLKSFYVDHGVTLAQIGGLTALYIGLLGLVGAPLGAWLLARPGASARGVAVACGGAAALCLAVLGLVVQIGLGVRVLPGWDWLYVALPALQAIADGAASLAFLTLFMRWSAGPQPGTDFTLFLCAESLGGMLLASIAGLAAAAIGYAPHFVLGAAGAGLAMLYAWRTTAILPDAPLESKPHVLA